MAIIIVYKAYGNGYYDFCQGYGLYSVFIPNLPHKNLYGVWFTTKSFFLDITICKSLNVSIISILYPLIEKYGKITLIICKSKEFNLFFLKSQERCQV